MIWKTMVFNKMKDERLKKKGKQLLCALLQLQNVLYLH